MIFLILKLNRVKKGVIMKKLFIIGLLLPLSVAGAQSIPAKNTTKLQKIKQYIASKGSCLTKGTCSQREVMTFNFLLGMATAIAYPRLYAQIRQIAKTEGYSERAIGIAEGAAMALVAVLSGVAFLSDTPTTPFTALFPYITNTVKTACLAAVGTSTAFVVSVVALLFGKVSVFAQLPAAATQATIGCFYSAENCADNDDKGFSTTRKVLFFWTGYFVGLGLKHVPIQNAIKKMLNINTF